MDRAPEDPIRGEGKGAGGASDNLTIDLCAFEVHVPLPGGDTVRVDPRAYRADVVRRLLLLGASEPILTTLLPEWHELIRQVADELRARGSLSG